MFFNLLNLIFSYPIQRFQCGAIINSSYYDLNNLIIRNEEKIVINNFIFHLKICGSFNKIDIPNYDSIFSLYSLISCDNISNKCIPLISKFSKDFLPLNNSNLKEGIKMIFKGQLTNLNNNLEIWNIIFNIKCNKNQNNSNIPIIPLINKEGLQNNIIYSFNYSGACPKETPLPIPTPEFKSKCQLITRDINNPLIGIQTDFSLFNNIPGGLIYNFLINQSKYFILYQPCERINGLTSSLYDELSSLWFCTENLLICKNFGIVNLNMSIWTHPKDLSEPVVITMNSNTDSKSKIAIFCDVSLPKNHFQFISADLSNNNSLLNLKLLSNDVCIQQIPPPIPKDSGHCYFKDSDIGINVSFNASSIDIPNGYRTSVSVIGGTENQQKLIFQPCSGIYCPKDANCGQYEDSHIWLCKDISMSQDKYKCISYGLFKNNISMTRMPSGKLSDGIKVKYIGSESYSTEIDFICDHTVPSGQIYLPNKVLLQDESSILSFSIRLSDSCPVGVTPTPPPPFYPDYPSFSPLPSPLPSPIPYLFSSNNTHYIYIDLSEINQPIKESSFNIVSRGSFRKIYHIWKPWGLISCPKGGNCKGYDTATSWVCWFDDLQDYVCYPIGNIYLGLSIDIINDRNFELGSKISYEGANGVKMGLLAHCLEDASNTFPLTPSASYSIGMGGIEYLFESITNLSCPKKFITPIVPIPHETTPKPNPNIPIKLNERFIQNKKEIFINLSKLNNFQKEIVLVSKTNNFEKSIIYFNFEKRINCLDNYICDKYEPSNIWKCFNNFLYIPTCFPIGDIRFGLNINLINSNNIENGIEVTYKGGLDNYSTSFHFLCDPKIDFYNINYLGFQSNNKNLLINIYSKNICSYPSKKIPKNFNLIFLIILIILFILISYFGLGIYLIFIFNNQINIPNKLFWIKLIDKIELLFYCNNKNYNYNEI